MFTYLIYDLAPWTRVAEVPFSSVTWTEELGRPGALRARLPWYHARATFDYLEPGRYGLFIDDAGELRWGGIIWQVDLAPDTDAELTVAGQGLWSYYERRWLRSTQGMTYADSGAGFGPADISFTAVDQFRIVEDFIDHAANIAGAANIDFTDVRRNGVVGGALSGVTRTKAWLGTDRKRIAQAVADLARQTGGLDHSVGFAWDTGTTPWTPQAYLDLWYPRRGQVSSAVLEHGSNVSVLRLTRDGFGVANPLVAIGPGIGDAAITVEVEDSSLRYPAGVYPFYEDTVEYREDGQEYAGNLSRLAAARLLRTSRPVTTITLSLVDDARPSSPFGLGSFGVGDTVRVVAEAGSFSLDEPMRIVRQTVTVEDVGITDWQVDLAPDDVSTGGL